MKPATSVVTVTMALILVTTTACREAPEIPRPGPPPVTGASDSNEQIPLFTGGANQLEVTLFFLRQDGEALAGEKRNIFRTASLADRARQTVQALLEGPQGKLQPSVPPGTQLKEIFLTRDGTAFVDLSAEFRRGIEAGTSDAVYGVYAIVNTLGYNFPEILKVKVLIDGDEAEDIGGHLDLSRPILPEMGFVSSEPEGALPSRPIPARAPEGGSDPNRRAAPLDGATP